MFGILDALEMLGSDADLVDASPADRDAMLRRTGLEPAVRAALLAGDVPMLHTLLRAPDNVCALINPAKEEEDEEEEEPDEEEDEGDDHEDPI